MGFWVVPLVFFLHVAALERYINYIDKREVQTLIQPVQKSRLNVNG